MADEEPQSGLWIRIECETDLVGSDDLQRIFIASLDDGIDVLAPNGVEAELCLVAADFERQRVAGVQTHEHFAKIVPELEVR